MKFTLHLIAVVSAVYRGEPEVYIAHVKGKVRTTLSKTNKQLFLHYLYQIIFSIAQDFWGQEVFQYIKSFFWSWDQIIIQWLKDGTGSIL